jgi:hypothetical protein
MAECHDIILREADGPSPPDILGDLVQKVHELFTPAADGAGKWLQGKGEAELAKAAEIKSRVMTAIAGSENDRLKLLQEREASLQGHKNESDRDRMAHEERMYQLRTERLTAIVDRLYKLRELGVEVDMALIGKTLLKALKQEV